MDIDSIYITDVVQQEYAKARRRAWIHSLNAAITHRRNSLHSLHEVDGKFVMESEHYLGVRQVPVREIVGSMARYRDFDLEFNPLHTNTRDRWLRVAGAQMQGVTLPPVELLKVGESYIVRDGNHRVSVAHHYGVEFIDAEVTELVTPCSFSELNESTVPQRLGVMIARTREQLSGAILHIFPGREAEPCLSCE
ncbi:MAG: hypothetical protein ABI670_22875 [Chloroflexota bacterium]